MSERSRPLLHKLVVDRAWSYAHFRRAYEQAAKDMARNSRRPGIATCTVAEQTFRRWTGGKLKSLPREPVPEILELMFGESAAVLLGLAGENTAPQHDVPVFRESELAMTARDAAAHASDAAALSVSDMTLDQLDDDVRALARAYSSTPPTVLYGQAKALLLTAQRLLDRTQLPRQRSRAYYAAGQSAAVLSAVSFDLGSLSAAVQLARTAALYGQVIEHGPLQAYAHGALALFAFWDGRPSEAVRLVNTAQQYGGLGHTARVRLSVIEGRAYGHLGNAAEAQRAISATVEPDTSQRDELHDDIGGEFAFPEERVAMSNATTLLLLRDATGAERAASRALDVLDSQPMDERPLVVSAQAAIDLGRARLVRGELDGAQDALQSVFDVPAQWRGAGMLERLSAARVELTRSVYRSAQAAQSLAEQIEDFTAVATARRLGGVSQLALEG